jgi:beta-lactamase class A
MISPIPNNQKGISNYFTNLFARPKDPDELKSIIEKQIGNNWKNYSVYVKDFRSDFKMDIGGEVIFTAASVNKLPILAVLYYLVQKGEIDMDQIITLQADDIQDYGTGIIRYDSPGTTYTVKTLARLMMEKSDNTAAYILANLVIGLDKIQTIINSWGLRQTDMANNKTSNQDMYKLLDKMINGNIASQANSIEMLSFLTNSDFEDRIPALLPKDTTVYHKIGNGANIIHDVGVITDAKHKYYLGILTADLSDQDNASETAALISKTVYNYLQ